MNGTTQNKLAEAIAEVRRAGDAAVNGQRNVWHLELPFDVSFAQCHSAIATILDAVLSGQLVPAPMAPAPEAASDDALVREVAGIIRDTRTGSDQIDHARGVIAAVRTILKDSKAREARHG